VVSIGRRRKGTKIVAYHVPKDIYTEEFERREQQKLRKEQQLAIKAEQQEREKREKTVNEQCAKFPKLDRSRIEEFYDQQTEIKSFDEVGYLHKLGTKSYWRKLGFNVIGNPVEVVVRGKQCFNLYRPSQLRDISTRTSLVNLKNRWLKKYGSSELALAEALRFANRLQKVCFYEDFYALKDQWIKSNQHLLVDGKIARVEERMCWSCDGSGMYYKDEECWKCSGTGIYSSRTLYEHRYRIEDRVFSFHSYVQPKLLGEEKGADLPAYGQPFRPDELPLPPQSMLIKLIEELM